jgi:hypothetical protein
MTNPVTPRGGPPRAYPPNDSRSVDRSEWLALGYS